MLAVWLVAGARTDAGLRDVAFLTALAAFTTWVGLSAVWSVNPAETVLELERDLVFVGGCAAFIALADRATVPRLATAILAAITLVSTYSLATRLFANRFGTFDRSAVYRLSEPIGYWNALGIFAGLGILLALGLVAADEGSVIGRSLAGMALALLPVTLFFTYSRASWVSVAFGVAVTVGTSTRRLKLLTAAVALAPAPILGVLAASRSGPLTHKHASLAAVVHDGHRLALELVLLAAIAVTSALSLSAAAKHVSIGRPVRRAIGASLGLLGVLVVLGGLIHVGGPLVVVKRGYDSFVGPDPTNTSTLNSANLNSRLLSLSGNGRGEMWGYAWDVYRLHPVLGTGAGTFEREWQLNPKATLKVRDAHGLYIETLSELGPIGLALLLLVLVIPVAIGVRVRRSPLVPSILGAYSAFLLHAGVDWDWELAGVTLTALLIGCLAIVSSRTRSRPEALGPRVRFAGVGLTIVLAAGAAVGLLGNIPLSRSTDNTSAGLYDKALTEAVQARRWQPWSPQPWIAQGEAELSLGERRAALASFRKAIAKDDREWRAWLDLALASKGPVRSAALNHAEQLYPRSREIADAIASLAAAGAG